MKIVVYTKKHSNIKEIVDTNNSVSPMMFDVSSQFVGDENVNEFVQSKLNLGFACAIFSATDVAYNVVNQEWKKVA